MKKRIKGPGAGDERGKKEDEKNKRRKGPGTVDERGKKKEERRKE